MHSRTHGRAEDGPELLGHHALSILIVSILAVVAVGLYPLPGVLSFTVPVALFAVVIIAFLQMRRHDRGMCERCISLIPSDPVNEAKRLRRRFWVAHTGSEPRFLLPYLAVLIGSNFTTTTYGRYGWALVQLTMIYLLLAQGTHRRLQPWCPWCSDGGGGEDVDQTPPVLPRDDRQLT